MDLRRGTWVELSDTQAWVMRGFSRSWTLKGNGVSQGKLEVFDRNGRIMLDFKHTCGDVDALFFGGPTFEIHGIIEHGSIFDFGLGVGVILWPKTPLSW